MDPIFIFYHHLPIIVVTKENVEMPICGCHIESSLYVSKQNPSSQFPFSVSLQVSKAKNKNKNGDQQHTKFIISFNFIVSNK
jgi:lysophosphatidylcholine acyltransferase/lyso-PAF acetyltransferase